MSPMKKKYEIHLRERNSKRLELTDGVSSRMAGSLCYPMAVGFAYKIS